MPTPSLYTIARKRAARYFMTIGYCQKQENCVVY